MFAGGTTDTLTPWHDHLIRLAYIDESYTDAYYFIGAVIVDDGTAPALDRALDEVAEAARTTHLPSVPGPLELHGYPLFQGKGEWAAIKEKTRARIAVYEDCMRAIGQQDVQVFLHGLDRRSHRAHYGASAWPAHEVILPRLLERLNDFGRDMREQILVIADEVDDPERHRLDLHQAKLHGTPGYRSSRLENILDTLHFAPSHHSRLIQAADLVTFLHRRHRTKTNPDPREAATTDRLWSHIQPRVRHDALQPW